MLVLAYRPLGTLRFILALLVMAQHYLQWEFPGLVQKIVMPALPGNTAVLVFFFLSGFVIIEAADLIYAGRPQSFIVNRFLRIVPIFAGTILLTFCILYLMSRFFPITDESGKAITVNPFTFKNIWANLLAIVPTPGRWSNEPSFPVLRIAWALRVEVAFYAVVAGLLVFHYWRPIAFRVYFNTSSLAFLLLYGWYLAFEPSWNLLIGFVPYFCAGGAYYFWLKGSRISLCIFLVAILLSLHQTAFTNGISSVLLYSSLIGASLFLASTTLPRNKTDHFLGDLSYPIYVGHWFPLLLFAAIFGNEKTIGSQIGCTALGVFLPIMYFLTFESWTRQLRTAVRGVSVR